MINLIFDMSNMFFRSLYMVGGYGTNTSFDTQQEIDQLIRKVSTDITYIIRNINPSRIIFAFDSKSWRKNIQIDENEGYKANRDKKSGLNWDNIYAAMDELKNILNSFGFITTKIENAEADDIMALWTDELLINQNQHVILVSSDEDIRQLVRSFPYDDKLAFSCVYNPFTQKKTIPKKLYVPNEFEEWLLNEEEGDIFNRALDIDKQDFKNFKTKENLDFVVTNGRYIAMKKVMCGDDGDNVPAIYSWLNDSDKLVRITPSKFEKIIKILNIKDYKDIKDKGTYIYEEIAKIAKHEPSIKIDERINRQIKLVVLDPDVFPKDIINTFSKNVESDLSKSLTSYTQLNMNTLLEGTRFVNTNFKRSGNTSSIFKDIDNLTKKLF